MSRVLKTIESNVLRNTITTPVKSPRKEFHGNKSAKKYRAADLLDAALKHERSGDKEAALAAYEDAAENISNNSKILAKIALLKSQISADIENLAMEKVTQQTHSSIFAPDLIIILEEGIPGK